MRLRFRHIRDHLSRHGFASERLELDQGKQALVDEIRALLPGKLAAHCLDLKIADGRLTLFLDSTAWLTRARFLSGEILTSLKSYHVDAVGFQIRLPERESSGPETMSRRPRLSETAARHLLEAAEHQRDPRLCEALRRLARHGTRATPEGQD
jgi:hypothetical protein